MDAENLRTASLYINNQLLSRGLLRDGQNIDFTDPAPTDMGRIISVVNDLILRRDRDAEHRESLSSTLRNIRAETQRQTTDFARQQDQLIDTQRKLDGAEATERTLRTQLKTADATIHKLKDEMAKMKTLVAQTRSACANETRKRDRQVEGLKKALTDAGRVRGGGKSRDVMSINVTGDFGSADRGLPAGATEDEAYSLRMETNEFLTELAKGLSEENEGLLALVKRTVDGLTEMSGLEAPGQENAGDGDAVVMETQRSAADLSEELDRILDHLRNILTNPSFVPIEEVELREEEINNLRAGLDRMETRWKDAIQMLEGWRKRMGAGGRSVDMDELDMGLRLSPVRVTNIHLDEEEESVRRLSCVQEEEEEEEDDEEEYQEEERVEEHEMPYNESLDQSGSLHLVPADSHAVGETNYDSDTSSIFQDDIDVDDLDNEEPNVQVLNESTASSFDLPEPPQLSPLKDAYASGNRGLNNNPGHRKGPGDFSTILEENTWDLAKADEPPAPPLHGKQNSATRKKTAPLKASPQVQEQAQNANHSTSYDSPLFGKSGERPSQTDPSRKLFSKPSPSPAAAVAKSSPQVDAGMRKKPAETTSTKQPVANAKRAAPEATRQSPAKRRQESPPTEIRSSNRTISAEASPHNSAKPSVDRPRNRSPLDQPTSKAAAPTPSSSRLPRPPPSAAAQSPVPVTMESIAAKLAATEREADAARVRAKLKAARMGRRGGTKAAAAPTATTTKTAAPPTPEVQEQDEQVDVVMDNSQASVTTIHQGHDKEVAAAEIENVDPVKKKKTRKGISPSRNRIVDDGNDERDELAISMGSATAGYGGGELKPQKRDRRLGGVGAATGAGGGGKRTSARRASRRRSTLSPWELESLISGDVAAVSSPAR